ncbi:helix-turn-helix domain protein [Mycobacterium xenopi 3993]|nr:helix-turn-helix domain protein [Mycobacterium xenopi 3993]
MTTIVRRRTGRTVQEWIIERRMAEARSLLADTDLPVREVARRVGICDRDISAGCSAACTATRLATGAEVGRSCWPAELRSRISDVRVRWRVS